MDITVMLNLHVMRFASDLFGTDACSCSLVYTRVQKAELDKLTM